RSYAPNSTQVRDVTPIAANAASITPFSPCWEYSPDVASLSLIVTGRVLLRRTPVPARRKTSELEVCHGSARHVDGTRPFTNGAREAVLLQIARRRGG